eukprot:9581453-Heterocapsa_arctica.AAC.1
MAVCRRAGREAAVAATSTRRPCGAGLWVWPLAARRLPYGEALVRGRCLMRRRARCERGLRGSTYARHESAVVENDWSLGLDRLVG